MVSNDTMQATDLQVIKDIPGYKVILKAVLKSQIQQLVEQLADHTGEESVILTASVSDGSLSHLGSESGKVFLEDHDDIKSQFLGFCLKRHHRQKQLEKEGKEQQLQDPGGHMLIGPTIPTSYDSGPRTRFSQRHFVSHSQSARGVHPASLNHASPQSGPKGVRHEPYPVAQPRKTSSNLDAQCNNAVSQDTETSRAKSFNTNPNEIIKVEPIDDEENSGKTHTEEIRSSADSGHTDSCTYAPAGVDTHPLNEPQSSILTTMPSTPVDSSHFPGAENYEFKSSSSTSAVINKQLEDSSDESFPPEGPRLDSKLSSFTGISGDSLAVDMSASTSVDAASDSEFYIKVEAITESELDLEITGVEPGQTAHQEYDLMSVVQTGMGYGPSTSGNAQGDLAGQSSQGYTQPFSSIVSARNRSTSHRRRGNSNKRTSQQEWPCGICGKVFKWSSHLELHKRIHTGDKPFTCSICSKSFTQKGTLKAHLLVHQNWRGM